MRAKLGGLMLLALFGTANAGTTTYYYSGTVTASTSTICVAVQFGCLNQANPNAAADAAAFGTEAYGTATLTFPFDTAGVTETFGLFQPRTGGMLYDLYLGALHYAGEARTVRLVDGLMTGLEFNQTVGCPTFTSVPSASCVIGGNIDGGSGNYNIVQVCSTCTFRASVRGEWTNVAPVPGPIAGAGVPGLIAGFAGLAWWRRRRLTGRAGAAGSKT